MIHHIRHYRALYFFLMMLGTGFLVFQLSIRYGESAGKVRRGLQNVAVPAIGVGHAVTRHWTGFFGFCTGVWTAQEENKLLKTQLSAIQTQLATVQNLRMENHHLRDLLNLRQENEIGIPAMITGGDASEWYNSLLLNRGSKDGVAKDSAVVAVGGVVGQVIEAGGSWCRVQLLTNKLSGIHAMVLSNRGRGILHGNGDGTCTFEPIDPRTECHLDDTLVTTGFGGVFPAGKILGRVKHISVNSLGHQVHVTIQPAVSLSEVEGVLVFTPETGTPAEEACHEG